MGFSDRHATASSASGGGGGGGGSASEALLDRSRRKVVLQPTEGDGKFIKEFSISEVLLQNHQTLAEIKADTLRLKSKVYIICYTLYTFFFGGVLFEFEFESQICLLVGTR